MFHAKRYMYIFIVTNVFSCFCSLLPMKEIKDHVLKIEKNQNIQNAPEILIPESLKVFYCSFLPYQPESESILILDEFHVAFATQNGMEVWDLRGYGKCRNIFEHSDEYDSSVCPVAQNALAISTNDDNNGSIIFWNFYDNTQRTFSFKNTLIGNILPLTETQYVFMALSINSDHLKIIIFNRKKPQDLKKIAFNDIIGKESVISKNTKDFSFKLKRLSNTKILFKFTYEKSGNFNYHEKFIVFDTETMMHSILTDFTTTIQDKMDKIKSTDFIGITQKSYACANQDTISIFDINSGKKIQTLNIESQIHLLYLPINNALISVGVENNIMNVFSIENFHDTIQSLSLPPGEYGKIVSISYLKNTNTIMIITKNRYIITCKCNLKNSKNILGFLKNLMNNKNKKNFNDVDFIFKNDIDNLCKKLEDTNINN